MGYGWLSRLHSHGDIDPSNLISVPLSLVGHCLANQSGAFPHAGEPESSACCRRHPMNSRGIESNSIVRNSEQDL